MKKLLFIMFFIAGSVNSQIYSINPSFDSLKANVLAMVNSSTSGNITDDKISFIVNMSIGEICDALPALEKVDTIIASRTADSYSLNSDFLRIKNVFRIDRFGDLDTQQKIWTPIGYVPYDSLAELFNTPKKNADNQAKTDDLLTSYTWNRKLHFQPLNYKPSSDPDTFIVFYYARDVQLVNGTDSTNIAPEYMEELMYYMMSWVRTLQEDYGSSDFYLNRYNASSVTPKSREVDLKR